MKRGYYVQIEPYASGRWGVGLFFTDGQTVWKPAQVHTRLRGGLRVSAERSTEWGARRVGKRMIRKAERMEHNRFGRKTIVIDHTGGDVVEGRGDDRT